MAATGTVKFFNSSKGFGFITQDNGSPDVFVHGSNISGDGLNEGDKVQFDIEIRDDGRARAINVQGGTRQGYVYGEQNNNNGNNFRNNNGNYNNGYGGNQGGYGGNQGGYGGNQGGYGGNQGGYGGNQGGYGGQDRGSGQQQCFTFRDNGACSYGDNCKYSHQM